MDDHAGLFVEQEQVVVLIDDVELRRRLEKFVVLFFALLKELVLDKERQHVAFVHHILGTALFAVDLHAFFADIFVHQCFWHGTEPLLQELVQPLVAVVFADRQLSHEITASIIPKKIPFGKYYTDIK